MGVRLKFEVTDYSYAQISFGIILDPKIVLAILLSVHFCNFPFTYIIIFEIFYLHF